MDIVIDIYSKRFIFYTAAARFRNQLLISYFDCIYHIINVEYDKNYLLKSRCNFVFYDELIGRLLILTFYRERIHWRSAMAPNRLPFITAKTKETVSYSPSIKLSSCYSPLASSWLYVTLMSLESCGSRRKIWESSPTLMPQGTVCKFPFNDTLFFFFSLWVFGAR